MPNGSCTIDGDNSSPRTADLLTGMDRILEGFGDSPLGGVNSNDAGVSGTRTEERVDHIDRILGSETMEGVYEDHSTLTVSFSLCDSKKEELWM